jgi:hypothetical protein
MSKRFYVIACEILFREVCFCASKSRQFVDVAFLHKGLHDIGEASMSKALQGAIDAVDCTRYDAILLCYGLCNNGVRNLHAQLPMVIPRAHDCITLLLGSKEKYAEYFANNTGTYFHSSGWLERGASSAETEGSIPKQMGMGKTYEEYADEFGEENAEYLMSILGNWLVNYTKAAFINNGIGDVDHYRKISKAYADEKNWVHEEVEGSITLIERLIDGEWEESDFLIIPPKHVIVPSNDSFVVTYALPQ